MIHAHIIYSGLVQGVGFRFSVHRFAANLPVAGWVRNLNDGRVEIRVEGEQKDIELLTKNIEARFEGNIRERKMEFSENLTSFKDFQIVSSYG